MNPIITGELKPITNKRSIGHSDVLVVDSIYGLSTELLDALAKDAERIKERVLKESVLAVRIQIGPEQNLERGAET